jgi:RNA polymerase sigma factor (sigma-70 family)
MGLFKKHISKLDDLELIALYQKDYAQKYVSELYSRYAHLVLGVSLKYLKNQPEAKDATQDVYAILVEKLKTHQISNFSSWLHQLTKNECLMKLRKNKRIEFVQVNEQVTEEEEEDEISEKELLEVKIEQLFKEIDNLKPAQAECVKLFFLKKMSYREIADKTVYSEKEIKSYIQNGKRNLKNQLMNYAEFRTEERNTRTA